MTRRVSLVAACVLAISGARSSSGLAAQSMAAASLPQTAAGRTLKTFLETFNAGDSAAMDAFVTRYKSVMKVPALMQLRNNTGGFDLVSLVADQPLHIDVVVREKKSPTVARMVVNVSDGEPVLITGLGI